MKSNGLKIKWTISHDTDSYSFLLIGDYNKTRFVKIVYDGLWGIPLMYNKWLITNKFKILYKNEKEEKES